ncbi:MAG: uncharacterized protein JWN76_2687, partial [Chitinophagaceae bacterium]|nr:uncharacterized protein [Chitinophagaceae bacterium]
MASYRERFEIPGKMRTWSLGLIAVGVLALIIGFVTKASGGEEHQTEIFWGTIMYNSIFFLLICNASMFFICATTLAMGGWQLTFRRVAEAISSIVPIFGVIAFVVLMYIVFGGKFHGIYHWLDKDAVSKDDVLKGKSGFLNPTFFLIWTVLAIGLWSLLGMRMRKLSAESDENPMDTETGKRYIFRNTVTASLFIVWFALTVGSTIPWLWMMSIDAHWYSTMYSWYTFASSFVSGMALICLFVIYLKNKGFLEYTTDEHLHDIGKFMFAFSIFWTYLWFSQYMLIWYANIPEETVYFKNRVQGPYKGIFFLNLIINFICPLLILMKRSAKRNYTLMTFMAVLILFGHWIDFYQMVMGSISKDHVTLGWLDFGIAALFVGMIIFFVGRSLVTRPLIAKYHPFLKES